MYFRSYLVIQLKKSKCLYSLSWLSPLVLVPQSDCIKQSLSILFALTADLPFTLLSKTSVSSSADLPSLPHRLRPTSLRAVPWCPTPHWIVHLEPKMNCYHRSPHHPTHRGAQAVNGIADASSEVTFPQQEERVTWMLVYHLDNIRCLQCCSSALWLCWVGGWDISKITKAGAFRSSV